ncbi:hypothetical protein TNCV_2716631 [Trichonephila clavipes]|nr:hypothetical protein TNCV_2716631 [Trichonephila clavipes]
MHWRHQISMLPIKLSVTEMGSEDQTRSRLCSSSPKDIGGGLKATTCLPRHFQRCSIGFKSGDRAGYSIRFKPRPSRYSSTITSR